MIKTHQVHGLGLDGQTRCQHYASAQDVIAIKHSCCGVYYACLQCHEALAGHGSQPWPRGSLGVPMVLCGVCGLEMTLHTYLHAQSRCPRCQAAFNPRCAVHYPQYFGENAH